MADTDALTPRQREIYYFIRSKIQGRGYGPTVREIGLEFLIKSPNGVMCHLKALQKKLMEADLTFPVAVDNKTTMWKRYFNNYWPSVYLINKEGVVCWGWQGELGWKGAKGEPQMRAKVEELLK